MKLLLVNDSVGMSGGSHVACRRLCDLVSRAGDEVVWFGADRGAAEVADAFQGRAGVHLWPVPVDGGGGALGAGLEKLANLKACAALRRCLRRHRPDAAVVCNVHNWVSAVAVAELVGRLRCVFFPFDNWLWCERKYNYVEGLEACRRCADGVTSDLMQLGCGGRRSTSTLKYAARRAFVDDLLLELDGYICPSSSFRGVIEARGVRPEQCLDITYPFEVGSAAVEAAPPPGDFVLYFGLDLPAKGTSLLARTWARHPELPLLRMVFPGPVALAREAEGIANLELLEGVSWHNGLGELLRDARCVIIPSLWDTPGEQVLYEAVAQGKCTILSARGFHLDFAAAGSNALLFEPADEESLVHAVELACTSDSTCAGVASAGLAHLQELERDWAGRLRALLRS